MGSFLVSGNVYCYKIKHEFFEKSNTFESKIAKKEQTIHFIGCCHCVRLALSSLDRSHHFHEIFIHIFLRLELVLLHLVVFAISSENHLKLFNILLIILRSFQVKHQSTIQNQLFLRLLTLLILRPSGLIVTLSNIHYVWVKISFIRSLLDRTVRLLAKFPFEFFLHTPNTLI